MFERPASIEFYDAASTMEVLTCSCKNRITDVIFCAKQLKMFSRMHQNKSMLTEKRVLEHSAEFGFHTCFNHYQIFQCLKLFIRYQTSTKVKLQHMY